MTDEMHSMLRVNVAVCGIFHYRHYVKYLAQRGVLNKLFYSHKVSTDSTALGVPVAAAVNCAAKEYLTHFHLRLMHHRLGNQLFPLYSDIWEWAVLRKWRRDASADCEILHAMLHGTKGRLIEHARLRGAVIVGEPVNSHPSLVQDLMRAEYDRLGIPNATVKSHNSGQRRTIEEAKLCDHLLVPSRFVASSYIQHGFLREKVHILPWGTDVSTFAPGTRQAEGRKGDRFRVLCVAQLSPRKGHIDLLSAWEALGLRDAELVFAGGITPEMAPILRMKSHLFRHVGMVPHGSIADLYRSADVVVLPSIEDGFSYVPLEAMACGLPVVVSANAGAAEIVQDGITGYVVPARSPALIAEKLERLYRDESLARSMGEAARNSMIASKGWDQYASRLCQVYAQIAGSHGAPVGIAS